MSKFRLILLTLLVLFSTGLVSASVHLDSPDHHKSLVYSHELASCRDELGTESTRFSRCVFPKTDEGNSVSVDFLSFTGSLENTAFDHGKLLAKEIDVGLIRFVLESRSRYKRALPAFQQNLFEGLYQCFFERMKSSLDQEFVKVHENLALGMRAGGLSQYTNDDVLAMSLATEMATIFSGLQRRIQKHPSLIVTELLPQCGSYLVRNNSEMRALFSGPDMKNAFMTAGCTGIAAPAYSSGDMLWMSRNLDGSAIGTFDKHPIVVAHDPRAEIPNSLRYMGVAAAGLHYAGGNSGFNEAGIGVTLHEMETEKYLSQLDKQNGLSAVYLQNRILERARSIEEAWDIVKNSGTFTAWTMVVGDAKTNEVAAFEFTGQKAVIANRSRTVPHFQANKFISSSMSDQFYNYSYNKVLESRFRLQRLGTLSSQAGGLIDSEFILSALSDHYDAYQGSRSFGRNLIKTNTMMTQIFAPSQRMMTTSLGDRYPIGQGRFLSFSVDFENTQNGSVFHFHDIKRSSNFTVRDRPLFGEALENYVRAYLQYKDKGSAIENLYISRQFLEVATEKSRLENHPDFAFDYMSSKLDIKLAGKLALNDQTVQAIAQALLAEQRLVSMIETWKINEPLGESMLHPYDEALTLIALARSKMLLASLNSNERAFDDQLNPDIKRILDRALAKIDQILAHESQKYELSRFRETVHSLKEGYKFFGIEEAASIGLDFVTVE